MNYEPIKKQKSKEKQPSYKELSYLLFVWFFVSILPQMLLMTRADDGNIIVKVILMGVFLAQTAIYLIRRKIKVNRLMILIFLYFVAIQIISEGIINRQLLSGSPESFINIILSSIYILIFIVIFNEYKMSADNIMTFSKLYLLTVIYASFYNIFINYETILSAFTATRGYEYNISSFFSNRNTFGYFLAFGIIASFLIRDSMEKNKVNVLLNNLMLLFIAFNLILTNSRTAMFSSIAYYVFRLLLRNKRKLHIFLPKLFVFILFILSILYISGLNTYIINIFIRPESGLSERGNIWQTGLDIFLEGNLVFRSGALQSNKYLTLASEQSDFHSTYITILTQGGLSLFIFNVLLIIKSIIHSRRINYFNKDIGINLMGATFMYLLASITETNILFQSSALSVISTVFIILLPKYYYNFLKSQEKDKITT